MKRNPLVKTLLKTVWVLELIIAVFILVMTLVQTVLTGMDCLDYLYLGQFSLNEFFVSTMNIVVGLEFVKMLMLHTPRAVTDVLLFAIARQLVVSHSSALETLLGVAAVALIFFIRKYLLTQQDSVSPPDFFSHLSRGGTPAAEQEERSHE